MKKTKVYKYTYDYVKNYIENECKMDWLDLKLLSNEYVKIKNKLIIEDSEHFKFHLSFDNIKISHKRKSKLEKFSPVNIFTLDNIQLYLNQINSGIMLLSNVYINNREKLCFKCKNNHIFERSLDNIFKYSQCLECEGQMRRTTEDFKRQVYNLVGEEYSVLGEFVSVDDPIKIKHNICGREYDAIPYCFLNMQASRCPRCNFGYHKNTEDIRNILYQRYNGEYELIGDYITGNINVSIRHNKCGHIWNVYLYSLLSENPSGCPNCNQSKGENKINNMLKYYNIYSIPQKKFDELVGLGGGNLSYDFYLPDYNLLIEYQGEFHDGSRRASKIQSRDDFEKQQEHDRRKREYAKQNNYNLLEIWYYDFDHIEDILVRELAPHLTHFRHD
jgi:hypothetical protein